MTTAADIKAALRRAYPAPSWAILFEVANATGARQSRYADAVAMSLWPSQGLGVEGFEIKVYRGDWKRELQNPEKAETIAAYCDHWWIVTPEKGVIDDPSELPPAWGWRVLTAEGVLVTKKQAVQTEAKPLDRLFVAALLRNAGKVDQQEVEALVEARLQERVEREVKWRTRQYQDLEAMREKLLAAIGEDGLSDFMRSEILAAVAAVYKSGVMKTWGGLQSILLTADTIVEHVEKLRSILIAQGYAEPKEPKRGRRGHAA
jgi:hypothetical protein